MKHGKNYRSGRWGRSLLVAAAACGQISFLFVHAQLGMFRAELGGVAGWFLALGAIAIPFAATWSVRFLQEARGVERTKARRIFVLEWLPLVFARVDTPVLFLLTSLVVLTGHALARPRQDSISAWALAGGLTLTLIGAAMVPSPHWLWLVPLSLMTFGAALVLLHVNRGLAHRESLQRWSFMSESLSTTKLPSPAQLAFYGLPFALLALICIPIVSFGILSIPTPFTDARRGSSGRSAVTSGERAQSTVDAATRVAFESVFPSRLAFGRGVARLEHETVMIVTPPAQVSKRDFRSRGPYYLRGLVQDHFSETGVTFGGGDDMRELIEGDDGWLTLREDEVGSRFELEIYQQPLLTRQGAWNILFSPQPILEVRAQHIQFDPDGVLVSLGDNSEWKRYAVRTGVDDARSRELGGLRARHPEERFTQLPPGSPELDQLQSEAERITSGSTGDAERVGRIVEQFRERFLYKLDSKDTPGLAGVLQFLDEQEGHCTDFAAASALMLRTIGIPARVATGFLADEWSSDAGGYAVTTRDGHAWLEVYFESAGWLRYEPTPSERRRRALRAVTESESGVAGWVSDLGSDLSYWASTGMDESDLRLWAQTLASGPRALAASFERRPFVFLGWTLALLTIWYTVTRQAQRLAAGRSSQARMPRLPEEDSYGRLLRALAKQGHRKPSSQTPREFALEVAKARSQWASIVGVTELLYRAQFGGEELTGAERESFETLARAING